MLQKSLTKKIQKRSKIEKNKKIDISIKKKYLKELNKSINDITSSKAFKYYQNVKKIINPKTYVKYLKNKIKKYKYNLENFEPPHHNFIILKNKNNKWEIEKFEKVGEDWHLKIIRKSDRKQFLIDQPTFYLLQLVNNKNINKETEMFITYGLSQKTVKKVENILNKLHLC